jgi:hypothetical protein
MTMDLSHGFPSPAGIETTDLESADPHFARHIMTKPREVRGHVDKHEHRRDIAAHDFNRRIRDVAPGLSASQETR